MFHYREKVGTYTTTSRCRDINVKTEWEYVEVCVVFIDHTDECNRWTRLPTGKWTVVASDVRDGTRFELRIRYWEWPERTGWSRSDRRWAGPAPHGGGAAQRRPSTGTTTRLIGCTAKVRGCPPGGFVLNR
jgi:hypothetical protein